MTLALSTDEKNPSLRPDPQWREPRRLGDYELLEELARGGMGVVYKARQIGLNRLVAVKTLVPGALATKEFIHRFRTEASAAANLQHPNIVAVHEVGTHAGETYLAMDLVIGSNLARLVDHSPLPSRRAATYVRSVAEAIHYAHERGVLHRDLKPSNVLVDENDQPRITDFGLAKRLDGEGDLTLSGQVLGSPNYISPEQATGERSKVGRGTDVYGLGAILYHLLTARPPFRAETLTATLQQVVRAEPVSPRLLNPSVPRDLETVTLKCLEKEIPRRYHSSEEVANELGRFLNGEPIKARPLGLAGKVWRWCRRKPAMVVALTVVVAAIVTAFISIQQARHAVEQRLTEHRRHALEKAMLAARTGDLNAAEDSIRDAELAGASAGEVRLLRGQVAMHRGDLREGIRQLEQSVRLLTDSVAAHSLLAISYINSGEWERISPLLVNLDHLLPTTPEDHLFLGQLEAYWDPVGGLERIDESMRQSPTILGRLVRSQILFNVAQLRADPALVDRCIADANLVRELFPDNPVSLSVSLYAQLLGAVTYEEYGLYDKRAAALRQAESDAIALKAFPRNPEATLVRVLYFKVIKEDAAILSELETATDVLESPSLQTAYAMILYRKGRFQEALQVMDKDRGTSNTDDDYFRPFVLAELPDGPRRSYEEFLGLWEDSNSTISSLVYQTILLLLGRKAETIEASRSLQKEADSMARWRHDWYLRLLDYFSDYMTSEVLLEKAGNSRWNLCEAHFAIGLMRLSEGDRFQAADHFRKATATRVFTFMEFGVSRLLAERLERDPDWPPWIPVRNETDP